MKSFCLFQQSLPCPSPGALTCRGVSGLPLAQVLPRQSPPLCPALGSLALAHSLQTLLLRSFSWLFTLFHTFCCLALLSSTCSGSQLVLHHLQLSSLSSSASFSHMGVCSCNHFHAFSRVLRCPRKPTKLTLYYLKLSKLPCIKMLAEQR